MLKALKIHHRGTQLRHVVVFSVQEFLVWGHHQACFVKQFATVVCFVSFQALVSVCVAPRRSTLSSTPKRRLVCTSRCRYPTLKALKTPWLRGCSSDAVLAGKNLTVMFFNGLVMGWAEQLSRRRQTWRPHLVRLSSTLSCWTRSEPEGPHLADIKRPKHARATHSCSEQNGDVHLAHSSAMAFTALSGQHLIWQHLIKQRSVVGIHYPQQCKAVATP